MLFGISVLDKVLADKFRKGYGKGKISHITDTSRVNLDDLHIGQ